MSIDDHFKAVLDILKELSSLQENVKLLRADLVRISKEGGKVKQLRADLVRIYDMTLERRKTLTSQAQNLMSFAGIIQFILVGLIVAVVTNNDAHELLTKSPNYYFLVPIIGIAFAAYIGTAVFSLLAFREPKYTPAPQLPSRSVDKTSVDILKYLLSQPDKYNINKIPLQYGKAIDDLQKTNNKKYAYLIGGTICLLVGISATIIGGFIMFLII